MASYDEEENEENKLINEGKNAASLSIETGLENFGADNLHRVQNMEEEQPFSLRHDS